VRATLGPDDDDIRAALAELVTALDADTEHAVRHDDFVAEIPQSRERIRGRDAMRELQQAFPTETRPTFTVRRITGSGDHWTVEATGDYGGQIYLVVVVIELREGKILRETRYYPEPFDAPEWRAKWVERIE
jgi:ketosteroid isomerase-like protein